jgi:hypothetical protein
VPHIPATIVSLSQDMDLKSGSMANFMVLELPNGKSVRALIGDESAQEIVHLAVEQNGRTIPAPPAFHSEPFHSEPPPPLAADVPPSDEATVIFGGNGSSVPPPPMEDPPPPPAPERRATTVPARRPKRVDKDEMGYPVVRMDGAVDPQDVTSSRDRDEDGVGQI